MFTQTSKSLIYLFIVLSLVGCASKKKLPAVLTSKDLMWTIPKGTTFKAIQKPQYKELTEFVVPDDDLAVIYKGSLLELEESANRRVASTARSSAIKGGIIGLLGSLFSIIAVFLKRNPKKKK